MRLICPNCAAQYEVDDGVIPEAGRDVQCSNCGHTWWQERAQLEEAGASVAAAPQAAEAPAPEAQPAMAGAAAAAEETRWPAEDEPPRDQPAARPPGETATPPWPEAPDEHAAPATDAQQAWPEAPPEAVGASALPPGAAEAPAPPPKPADAAAAPHRRSLDDAVLDVLRQEAAREANARKSEAGAGVESQPDLGLAEAEAGAVQEAARARADEMMRSQDAGEAEDESGRPERRVRRSKLPDVDEINSTLASHQESGTTDGRHVAAATAARPRRGAFRFGFTLMILIAIGIGAVYTYADRIVASAPATAPVMEVVVSTLDSARIWLDRAALNATDAITSLTEGN